jgi:hypothetical protein
MVRLCSPWGSLTALSPRRGTCQVTDRSCGQEFSEVPGPVVAAGTIIPDPPAHYRIVPLTAQGPPDTTSDHRLRLDGCHIDLINC